MQPWRGWVHLASASVCTDPKSIMSMHDTLSPWCVLQELRGWQDRVRAAIAAPLTQEHSVPALAEQLKWLLQQVTFMF